MKTDTTKNASEELDTAVDVSLEQYLADDSGAELRLGKVTIRFKGRPAKLTIAAISDDELEAIERVSKKSAPELGRGHTKLDPFAFKRHLAALSLRKANPNITEAQILAVLPSKEAGDVTTIAEAVVKLSGFDENRISELDRLVGFTS